MKHYEENKSEYEETIKKNVKRMLKEQNRTQHELATNSNLSESALSKILNKDYKISIDLLFIWAEFFHVSVYDLATEHGESTNDSINEKDKEQLIKAVKIFIAQNNSLDFTRRKDIADILVKLLELFCK